MTFQQASHSGDEWELVKEDEEVKVYEGEWEGYAESQFKGVRVIRQPIEIVAAVLADIPYYPEWFFNCKEAQKLPESNSPHLDFFIYIIIDVPWPFSDRDWEVN